VTRASGVAFVTNGDPSGAPQGVVRVMLRSGVSCPQR
jgi:hypothetical protein